MTAKDETRETRSAALGLRVFPTVKTALERAAMADRRTMAAMAEIIIVEWLKREKYLPEDEPCPSAAKPGTTPK